MDAMLGICLYSYLYPKKQKCYVSLNIFHVFSSTKSENKRTEQVLPGEGRRGGGPNNVYTCKCKNDKMKEREKKF
jgi:hypothetical protein